MNVEKVMIKNPKAIAVDHSIKDALDILLKNRFWVVPVVNEGGRLAGILHLQDILKAFPLNLTC
jgi:CBS domain-containing protein